MLATAVIIDAVIKKMTMTMSSSTRREDEDYQNKQETTAIEQQPIQLSTIGVQVCSLTSTIDVIIIFIYQTSDDDNDGVVELPMLTVCSVPIVDMIDSSQSKKSRNSTNCITPRSNRAFELRFSAVRHQRCTSIDKKMSMMMSCSSPIAKASMLYKKSDKKRAQQLSSIPLFNVLVDDD